MITDTKEFIKNRLLALSSLDKEKILAFARMYSISLPKSDVEFWLRVHKTIFTLEDFPEDIKKRSEEWLKLYGGRNE